MTTQHRLPRPTFLALPLALALAWPLPSGASDAHAEAAKPAPAKPAVAKPAISPASGALAPVKGKPAAEPATAAAATSAAAPAKPAADPDTALQQMLASRLGGTGELVLKTGDLAAAAKPAAPSAAAGASGRRAVRSEAADLAAAHRAAKAAEHLPHWSYSGAGAPDRWSQLDPNFSTCATGKRQSPIDIRDGIRVELEPVQFDYQPSGFRVIDNGHTVQVNVGAGNTIEVMGRRYELQQFHFHRPSEERINGRGFEMVAHLVHKDTDGRLAVVAVLMTRGTAQPVVQAVWNNLPLERHVDLAAPMPLDLARLLPEDRRYFTYMGSLTTPPCSEDVLWMVMKNPVQVSPEQIAIFSRLYPMNARPVQPLNARLIKESN